MDLIISSIVNNNTRKIPKLVYFNFNLRHLSRCQETNFTYLFEVCNLRLFMLVTLKSESERISLPLSFRN